jgi:hypothetical protein
MPALAFPLTSTPGHLAGEGDGRLVNCSADKEGSTAYIRRVPGLSSFATGLPASGCRGLIGDVESMTIGVFGTAVRFVAANGTVFSVTGTLPGSDGVTLARNNRVTTGGPDVVAVRESGGAYVIATLGNTVSAYPDADLPATVNSVCAIDGYLVFTCPDGRAFATDLNTTAVNALSFGAAEAKPDGLMRAVPHGGVVYMMGTETIEPWRDVGASPFPFGRDATVIPVGLLTTMAVAGFELGWALNAYFVAHDGTVRELAGYDTSIVSTPAVERFIAASTVSTLEASVFTSRGRAYFALSSDQGTWVLDVRSGAWHERVSTGATRWRAQRSVKSNGAWIVGDTLSASLLKIDDAVRTENGAALNPVVTSAPARSFPARAAIPDLHANFSQGSVGTVSMRSSRDGGATWSAARTRPLGGKRVQPWTRMGLASAQGLVVEFTVTGGTDFAFMGAHAGAEGRAP